MALLDVRTKFIALSGREDLNTTMLNWIINSGQKILDRLQDTQKTMKWYKKDLAAGEYLIQLQYVMTIINVYLAGIKGKKRLKKREYSKFLKMYSSDFDKVDNDIPIYWTPAISGLAPSQADLASADYTYDKGGIVFGDYSSYNSIVIMPPPDQIYTISVLAKWYQPPLSDDTDVSYWTEFHDDLLILSALYVLERFYRNSEGMKDYMSAIKEELFEIDNRVAEDESYNINQMRG